jgi:hypothetical protein
MLLLKHMVPIMLHSALVLGAWNGFASDFDATRGEAIKHHFANAYAPDHMSERGRSVSCQDNRIELTDDTKAVCVRALNRAPGERIPGTTWSPDGGNTIKASSNPSPGSLYC